MEGEPTPTHNITVSKTDFFHQELFFFFLIYNNHRSVRHCCHAGIYLYQKHCRLIHTHFHTHTSPSSSSSSSLDSETCTLTEAEAASVHSKKTPKPMS